MPLRQFRVVDFQSYYEEQSLDLEPHITFVAGRNDVGKSAVLRALRVLAEPQEGARKGARFSYDWDLPASAIWRELSTVSDVTQWNAPFAARDRLTLQATFALRPEIRESQRSAGEISAEVLDDVRLAVPEVLGEARGAAGYASGWKAGPYSGGSVGVGELATLARSLARGIRYIGPRSIQLARSSVIPRPELEPTARNLTDVLVYLHNSEPPIEDELTAFIRRAFPQIQHVRVPPSGELGGGYMGEPTVYYAGTRERRIPLRHCGTGVVQMLALGVAVLTADRGQVVLIDEPQAYLHPHAERTLFELLSAHPQHQYVIATHSHATLAQATLAQTRLVVIDGEGASRITAASEAAAVLDELEVSPADLWLADSLIWVEGPSDVSAIERVLRSATPAGVRVSTVVKALPDASLASAARRRTMERTYRLVEALADAVLPIPVGMRFLFDGDEKTDEQRERIKKASRGQAVFLPVRELENFFLSAPAAIAAVLEDLAHEGTRLSPSDIEQRVQAMLTAHDDPKLFPAGVRSSPAADVKGSEVLDRLWWELASARYEKTADAARLVDKALELQPDAIQQLLALIRDLAMPVAS